MAPKITLDTTLADLYRQHGLSPKGPFIVTTHCVFGHLDLHPNYPRELTYPEDVEPVPFDDSNEDEKTRLRNIILGLKPLRRAFGVGDMDVLFFGPHVKPHQVERDLQQLPEEQRHRVKIIDLDKDDVFEKIKEVCKGRKLVFWRPQGWMNELPDGCLVDPQMAFDINAKDYLITAGIRTPPSEVISLDDLGPESVFATRELPFAVKLLRAGCGFGTYLVTSEAKREEMLAGLTECKKRGTKKVVLSEYVSPKLDLSVHFFIGAPGDRNDHENPLILGVSVQTLTESGKWVGGHIDYSAQEELQNMVRDTVIDTTRRVPKEFVGWGGVDILVDDKGEQWVVDLNARFTGSMPICFMSGHFCKERGLPLAQFAAFEYAGGRERIYVLLEEMIESGQVVVTAAATIGVESNMADIVWGGKDADELARVESYIKEKLAAKGPII
ncbi:hypothetical protein V8F20_010331 [Naviculisporaceae sp. PSN 640]